MLKYRVPNLDNVDAAHRVFYIADGKGGYRLDIEEVETAKRELDEVRAEHRATKEELKQLRSRSAVEIETNGTDEHDELGQLCAAVVDARASGEAAAIAAAEAELEGWIARAAADRPKEAERASLEADVVRLTVEQQSRRIASELATPGSEQVLIPHIAQRLSVETREGEHIVVVKNADGTPSEAGVAGLIAEFRKTLAFAPIIRGVSREEIEEEARVVAAVRGDPPTAKIVTRAEFDAMDSAARTRLFHNGGTVVDAHDKSRGAR